MTRRVAILLAVGLGVGVLAAVPVGLGFGPRHWAFAAAAFGLCLVPGVGTLVLADVLDRQSPYGRLLALVAGTAVRLVVGFGGAAAVVFLAGVDDRAGRVGFLVWVLFAYLVTLAAETALLAKPAAQAGRPVPPG
ncbi:MAG: hypothetical protein K2X87_13090 [Gemmataceae bacterium]|nr:hypothetical protein [Gemmataceae bacterium]